MFSLSLYRPHDPLRLAVFLLLLAVAQPCIAVAESQTAASPTLPVALGFDLGQSYGTSVARFENGASIPLAKVPGTPDYVALMERLVAPTTTQHWLSFVGTVGRLLGPFRLGLAATESRILASMMTALKMVSEAALQTTVEEVAVTAPWVAAWDNEIPADSVINAALRLASLKPWSRWAEGPFYLGEINTALASEEWWLCPRNMCAGHWMEVDGEETKGGPLFLVSFTNRSLYTAFQQTECYHFGLPDNRLASVDPRYGLDQARQAEPDAQFWDGMRSHLISLIKKDMARDGHSQLLLTILVTGEAADAPEFLGVVHDVVREIQQLCTSDPEVMGCKGRGAGMDVELVIANDRTYGPAKGAAFGTG